MLTAPFFKASRSTLSASGWLGSILTDRTKCPGTALHLCLGSLLVCRAGQEHGVRDAAALHVGKAGIRVGTEMEVGVEDRTSPRGVGLRVQPRSGGRNH